MKWKTKEEMPLEKLNELSEELGVNPLLLRIFTNRICNEDTARIALRDIGEAIIAPEKLVNGQAVADRIKYHIDNGSLIIIHADYDVDGLNSGYIFKDVIANIIKLTGSNAEVRCLYPERKHGYGLSMWHVEQIIHSNEERNILVLTCDNGIAQFEEIKLLQDNGIEVVVTDHHPNKETVPDCLICDPNNKLEEQDETFSHLCGAGVVFKVCELLQKNYDFHDMTEYVCNVAIATVADVMPLTAENMAFIKYGLEIINSDFCPANIKALRDFLGCKPMNAMNIGWDIGPMLNACGRMGDTALGGQFMEEKDYDIAEDIVNEIAILNDKRKDITKKLKGIVDKKEYTDLVCIEVFENVPEGIAGVMAGYMSEQLKRPSIALCTAENGMLVGSARTACDIDIKSLLEIEYSKGNVERFGGHSEACGVCIDECKLNDVIDGLNDSMENLLLDSIGAPSDTDVEETLYIDSNITIDYINKDTYELINTLAYDRNYFTEPVFALTDCSVKDFTPTKTNPANAWLTLMQNGKSIKLWCQGMTDVYKNIGCPKKVHAAGYVQKNFMAGSRPYILKIIDIIEA